MKKKLDLNNLLAKYEGMSGGQIVDYQSPVAHYQSRTTPIQQQFYQTDNYQRQYQTSAQTVTGSFQMSKSECQQFLIKIKEQLRNEERSLTHYAEDAMRHVHERFQANHEKIKRQILELLERSFQQNQRFIKQQLKRQGHQEPVEFTPVHKKISYFDQEINKLLHGLKGHQYRRSIAQVVMKDFNVQLSELREATRAAKQNYLQSLGQVEPDRQKIQCIKRCLQQLFKINKRAANLVHKSLFSVINDKFNQNGRVTATIQPQPQKQKTRKSFFNFGSD